MSALEDMVREAFLANLDPDKMQFRVDNAVYLAFEREIMKTVDTVLPEVITRMGLREMVEKIAIRVLTEAAEEARKQKTEPQQLGMDL